MYIEFDGEFQAIERGSLIHKLVPSFSLRDIQILEKITVGTLL